MQSKIIDPKELIKRKPVLSKIDLNLCVDCKATQLLCGLPKCPLLDALDVYPEKQEYKEIKSNSLFGLSPQVFIGSHGYPRVNSGPMTSLYTDQHKSSIAGDPAEWVDLELKEIIDLRFGIVRGKKNIFIKPNRNDKLYNQMQQLTKSINPVEIESEFVRKPKIDPVINSEIQPMGPTGVLNRVDITSNPKIPRKVDYILEDELTASQQLSKLYQEDNDVYYLQNVLSAGLTGLNQNKKLVPTRWSITATDDTIGKNIIPQLRDYNSINSIHLKQGELLGNYFTVIFLPGEWRFENFETWTPGGIFTLDAEKWNTSLNSEGFTKKTHYKGRTRYASQAGGYYASRLAVLEFLQEFRKKAKVVVIREISPEYVVPVGVWAVREGMRLTMKDQGVNFETQEELKSWLEGKLFRESKYYLNQSEIFTQTSLDTFFSHETTQ